MIQGGEEGGTWTLYLLIYLMRFEFEEPEEPLSLSLSLNRNVNRAALSQKGSSHL